MNCFACGRPIGEAAHEAITSDGAQVVQIGSECFKKLKRGGERGWQPPKGGPRLYLYVKGT